MDYHQNSLKAIVLDPKTDTNKYTNKYKPGIIPAIQNPTVQLEIRYMKKKETNICFVHHSPQSCAQVIPSSSHDNLRCGDIVINILQEKK